MKKDKLRVPHFEGEPAMNILYFSFEYPPFFVGGLGTYAYEMTRCFARMGHSVTVFAKSSGDALTRDLIDGVEVHRPLLADMSDVLPLIVTEDLRNWPPASLSYLSEVFAYNLLSVTKSVNQLVKADRRHFDVVVAHDWFSVEAGVMCKKAIGAPFVQHLHSVEEGRVGDGSPTIKGLERLGARKADLVVTVSYSMRDQLISLGYEEKKIRVVHNGVDEKKYDPARFSKEEITEFRDKLGVGENPVILFIGRLTWVKGVDTLVRAMPMILKEVPDAQLVILGKGDEEGLIQNLVNQLGIQENVKLHFKYVPEEERIKYYAAADVAVFPSKYEPFGIVCTEAMSMEKPVVVGARGVSGFREQIIPSGPNRCGSHVNPDDPRDVALFTTELLKDEDLRKKFGKNARKRVLESFTIDRIAEDTIKVYEEAVKATRS